MNCKQILHLLLISLFLFSTSEVQSQQNVTREKLSVLPSSFSKESKRNYPAWISHMQEKGYGNAIWQELEDILYDSTHFDLIMEPPTSIDAFRNILAGKKARGEGKPIEIELPDHILTMNVNFFVQKSESLKGMSVVTTENFHATVHLRYYDLNNGAINRAVPATADGVDADLIQATRLATRNATKKLLSRMGYSQ